MFEGPDRGRLRAAWRERFPDEAAPGGRDLSAVADDLRRLAEQAEPDQPGAEQAGDEDLSQRLQRLASAWSRRIAG